MFDVERQSIMGRNVSTAETIRQRRERLGLSQPALAAMAGCKQQDINRLETPGPKGTRHSKYLAPVLAALDREENKRSPGSAQPSGVSPSLAPDEVQAAFEVLFRRMCKTDKAAQWAAEAAMQVLQSREPLPYGLDRAGRVRSVVHDIAAGLSSQEH
jgi:transcriptional regulator with XRE-family HTH domain